MPTNQKILFKKIPNPHNLIKNERFLFPYNTVWNIVLFNKFRYLQNTFKKTPPKPPQTPPETCQNLSKHAKKIKLPKTQKHPKSFPKRPKKTSRTPPKTSEPKNPKHLPKHSKASEASVPAHTRGSSVWGRTHRAAQALCSTPGSGRLHGKTCGFPSSFSATSTKAAACLWEPAPVPHMPRPAMKSRPATKSRPS